MLCNHMEKFIHLNSPTQYTANQTNQCQVVIFFFSSPGGALAARLLHGHGTGHVTGCFALHPVTGILDMYKPGPYARSCKILRLYAHAHMFIDGDLYMPYARTPLVKTRQKSTLTSPHLHSFFNFGTFFPRPPFFFDVFAAKVLGV